MHVFSFPTPIHFGPGVRNSLRDHLRAQGLRRPLLVSDTGIASLPIYTDMLQALGKGLDTVGFTGISGNPVKAQVKDGVQAYKAHGADCIVGLGGGAALDVAKAIAVLAKHPGDLFDYEDGPNAKALDREIPYWVAIPTTAGTGSEVGRSTVISDDTTKVKKIIFSPKLLARAVFADPELTVFLPAKITAATGMDAITHCIEAYLARDWHPICDGIALEGLALGARALPRCVEEPHDVTARGEMLMASMMGAIAFQKGLGITHSCAHPLSTVNGLHHGLANGVMIERALAFNAEAVPDRFRTMARRLDLADDSPIGFLRWLKELKQRIGIPSSLKELGVKTEDLDRLSDLAIADTCHQNNPRPVTRADFHRLYTEAF